MALWLTQAPWIPKWPSKAVKAPNQAPCSYREPSFSFNMESDPSDNGGGQVVYFPSAYSAMAQSKVKSDEMALDLAEDQSIFHSRDRFISMKSKNLLVSIETVDGGCHLTSHHSGDVLVESLGKDRKESSMTLPVHYTAKKFQSMSSLLLACTTLEPHSLKQLNIH